MILQVPQPTKIDELVVNWHVNEACNYRCHYCYAEWQKRPRPEVWRRSENAEKLLNDLWGFFYLANAANPLRHQLEWRSVRLSLAGGEPTLLGSRLDDIARHAKALGFRVSLITNGSRLSPERSDALMPNLSMLGLSVDSIVPATNAAIGRVQRGGVLSVDDIAAIVEWARAINPSALIKINTVVNAANASQDLSPLIARVRPDRWKIMRMLPIVTDALITTSADYAAFLARHSAYSSIISAEDNDEMTQSYVMVDPHGRFFQNAVGETPYLYSDPILDVGPEKAFAQIPFDPAKFTARYPGSARGERS